MTPPTEWGMGRKDPKQRTLPFENLRTKPQKKAQTWLRGARTPDAIPDPSSHLTALLQEMRVGFKSLDSRFDSLDKRMDDMGSKLQAHDRRLDLAESRISDIEDSAPMSLKRLERIEHILKDVAIKKEDLEARSRRNNLRLIGVPESTNTGRLDSFVETLLMDLFGKEAFINGFAVERAHRSLGPRPKPGLPPRPIIARLLNFLDRDTALRLAMEKGNLKWQGSRLSLFPDFTMMVQEARRKYSGVKATLHNLGLKYGMLYLARLRVEVNGRPRIFDTPTAVQEFCRSIRSSPSRSLNEEPSVST